MELPEFYRRLVKSYKNRTSTDAELEVMMQLLREGKLDQYLIESMDEESGISDEPPVEEKSPRSWWVRRWIPYAAAAVLLFFLGSLIINSRTSLVETTTVAADEDVPPGGNFATITLGSGEVITLDQLAEGEILQQDGSKIRKLTNGQVVYEVDNTLAAGSPISYNTITTPNGGQYQIVLPDGSKVWLNAASSLKYPVRFSGNERQVELTGEAYFEISADESSPFLVASPTQSVRVTGTHFNINAYPEEQTVQTTLLEGKVTVATGDGKKSVSLKPGQQSTLAAGAFNVKAVDVEQVTDWKNGDFIFENENIHSIMARVARWYNVEVVYENEPNTGFFGQVSRSKNLSEVLQVLELTGAVNFKVEDRTITVLPPR